MNKVARCIATGFGSGLLPGAPGTWGSLAAVMVWFILGSNGALDSAFEYSTYLLFLACLGSLACSAYIRSLASANDPQEVVIDEWLGMTIALYGVPLSSPFLILCALCLFRIFDVIKPGPVRWVERFPGTLGIMLDDIVAGAFAYLTLSILIVYC